MNSLQYIENRTFDEIKIGDSAELSRTLKPEDISLFAVSSGDFNPLHLDPDYARQTQFHGVIAHGMWGGALISALIGTELPGLGSVYLDQQLRFRQPIAIGDRITVRAVVAAVDPKSREVTLDCACINQDGAVAIEGKAIVQAPAEKIRRPRAVLPEAHLHRPGERFRDLIENTRPRAPIRTAVIHPCDALSLQGALRARDETVMEPVLVGPHAKIEKAAAEAGLDIAGIEIIDAPHSHAAARQAVALAREGKVSALMKGALHTDEVMEAAIDAQSGLRTERRMSHVFAFDLPSYPRLLMITDAAINIYPSLDDKRDIVQNAIDLARALGVATPKVAILSAVETITPKIASTVDAAALCKMSHRGQISGGLVDGPLAFDNAISKSAAATKGIVSSVAGDADILVAPDLEAGNMIAKQLIYLAGADSAGIVLGARVPIMLTSRADDIDARLASAALAQLFVHAGAAQ